MHPEIVRDEPGTCPICGMKLVPVADGPHRRPVRLTSTVPLTVTPKLATHDTPDGLEWEDLMPEINRASDSTNMIWKLVDRDTGKENWEIDWAFRVGDRVKIRLVNDMDQDHPMHHPFHIHGAGRFLVLARDGVPRAQPRLEGHRPRPLRRDRRHPARRHQPGPLDGALPHRRAQPERDDVQLPCARGVITTRRDAAPASSRGRVVRVQM